MVETYHFKCTQKLLAEYTEQRKYTKGKHIATRRLPVTFSATTQPEKRRGRSRTISQLEVDAALTRIRKAADHGDLQASALLIALADRRPLLPQGVSAA